MGHVLLQQIDHPCHLTVDQNPVAALFQSRKWQVDGVWDRAQLHLHLRPDIYQKVGSLIFNHL